MALKNGVILVIANSKIISGMFYRIGINKLRTMNMVNHFSSLCSLFARIIRHPNHNQVGPCKIAGQRISGSNYYLPYPIVQYKSENFISFSLSNIFSNKNAHSTGITNPD